VDLRRRLAESVEREKESKAYGNAMGLELEEHIRVNESLTAQAASKPQPMEVDDGAVSQEQLFDALQARSSEVQQLTASIESIITEKRQTEQYLALCLREVNRLRQGEQQTEHQNQEDITKRVRETR
jgi:hypothetical protein